MSSGAEEGWLLREGERREEGNSPKDAVQSAGSQVDAGEQTGALGRASGDKGLVVRASWKGTPALRVSGSQASSSPNMLVRRGASVRLIRQSRLTGFRCQQPQRAVGIRD